MRASNGITVLVCGISGVGKTWLTRAALHKFPDVVTWRASEIIAETRKVSDPEQLRGLPLEEIHRSQKLLVRGFEARRRLFPDEFVILDAHSVIDMDNGYFAVPTEVVFRIEPAGIIHVTDDVEKILARRTADRKRVRPNRSLVELAEYQTRSIAACELYQDALKVPLINVHFGDAKAFGRAVDTIAGARV